jgi:hypothetical protein
MQTTPRTIVLSGLDRARTAKREGPISRGFAERWAAEGLRSSGSENRVLFCSSTETHLGDALRKKEANCSIPSSTGEILFGG